MTASADQMPKSDKNMLRAPDATYKTMLLHKEKLVSRGWEQYVPPTFRQRGLGARTCPMAHLRSIISLRKLLLFATVRAVWWSWTFRQRGLGARTSPMAHFFAFFVVTPVAVALRFVAFDAWCPTACDVFCARL